MNLSECHVNVPYLTLVHKADPDYQRDKRNEIEYDFSGIGSGKGRIFTTDRSKRWPYPGSGA
jgi:hypothetical protein